MEKFWKTYRTISLYLIFPAICMFVGSLFFNLLDQDPERFDRQTEGVVVVCVVLVIVTPTKSTNKPPLLRKA